MMYPLGISESVPIKRSDFYVLDDFIILDMVVDAYAHIILGWLFLATSGGKIDAKGWCLIFDIGENHVEFVLFENQNIPSPSSALEEDVDFPEISSFNDWWHVNPFAF